MEEEEPVTPMGRLSYQPGYNNNVILCAIGFKNPIDIDALKLEISNSIMIKIPRFSSILSVDPRDGSRHWKKVQVNLDDHIINYRDRSNSDSDSDTSLQSNDNDNHHPMSDDDVINTYLADMAVSSPMRMDKPLWELHIMHAQKCIIMKVHHAIGDGISLMSLLWTMGRSPRDVNNNEHNRVYQVNHPFKGVWKSLVCIWYTLVFGLLFIVRSLWVKDKCKVISGCKGVELWPRKVVTAKFKISDMKFIRKAIPNATVNDVLCGIVWLGLTRYLHIHYPKDLQDGVQVTGLCPYNLRQQPGIQDVASMLTKDTRAAWGNKYSMILLPFIYMKKSLEPLDYVTLAKEMMNRKKQSLEARLSYNLGLLMYALIGPKVGNLVFDNLYCNTSFVLSNIPGPPELITIGGNPVSSIRVTPSSLPQPLTMNMVGYHEWANMQIQVAKDVFPNPNMLAKFFEDALADMKEAAEKTSRNDASRPKTI
ncbi:wax ester synthase/diacylglycerol acyltransferase 2-like isoform X2 [Silene latifolia]|uniref:wax ester synthase/diacylglycerol acyltransferase 2-like isoform X2 n=1 Tax=Silene latifolia TaxID=37657 RepID=UPI003D7885C4